MTEAELRKLKVALNACLNNCLVEIKPGYDDSVTGFNEAWDIMLKFFEDKISEITK